MSRRTRANSRGPADSRGARSRVVSRHALAEKLVLERRRGRRIVFTSGCYDLLHVGHLRSFEQAAGLGDVLVVGVNRDRRVRELKGRGRPLTPERQRAEMVAGLAPRRLGRALLRGRRRSPHPGAASRRSLQGKRVSRHAHTRGAGHCGSRRALRRAAPDSVGPHQRLARASPPALTRPQALTKPQALTSPWARASGLP